MSDFNPPPGWPVPRDWVPESNWKPDPKWPESPPGWNFWVPKKLKMHPVDLSREIELGPVSALQLSKLTELTDGSADAIAWHICHLASETKSRPLTTYLSMQDQVSSALLEARRRIYENLMEGAEAWIAGLATGSAEWIAATDTVSRISESQKKFLNRAQQRLISVIEASGSTVTTEQQPKKQKPHPAEFTLRARPATATGNSASKERHVAGYVMIVLLIVLVVGGWVVSQIS
ncbi:hypothetical protein [Paenarthrobacter sp. C1]|uniref:hypothetical protein n=1 Tax=Paenarthrobacter sp. C1 TaxID=3400220 RepID=UPI003BF578F6